MLNSCHCQPSVETDSFLKDYKKNTDDLFNEPSVSNTLSE